MLRHGGELIHTTFDEYGVLDVVDHGEERCLYFDTAIQQSSVVLHVPEALAFEYYRAMLSPAACLPSLDNVLILGTGGGAMARALFHLSPQTHIIGIEYREAVLDLAYEYFDLPVDGRVECWVADAALYVDQCPENFDLVLVDLFDSHGTAAATLGAGFLRQCAELLTPHGVLAVNLWRNERLHFSILRDELTTIFEDRLRFVDVDDANTVALGCGTLCQLFSKRRCAGGVIKNDEFVAQSLKLLRRLSRYA